jgi:mono/diheme cytochrome c family protein
MPSLARAKLLSSAGLLSLLCLAAVAGIALAASAFATAPPALYTPAQADAGAKVYATNCAMCHGPDLTGLSAPDLLGQAFASPANKYTIGSMFAEITQQMPAGQPGSLSHDDYTDVFAYILQKNGFPAGSKPLAFDAALKSTDPLVSQVK